MFFARVMKGLFCPWKIFIPIKSLCWNLHCNFKKGYILQVQNAVDILSK